MRIRLLLTVFALLVAACSGSSADETTTSTAATTSTEATTTTVAETTTTVAETTTTEATTTTTTEPEDTTTTSEGEGDTTTTTAADDTTTTTGGETETTFPPTPTTSSTTIPEASIRDDLVEWEGVFRQPTAYPGFIQFRADGVVRAGFAFDDMPFEGTWDYDGAADAFVFSDFDLGGSSCGDAEGRYARDTAPGGGRTLTLIDDPCQSRVDFLTLPDSPCQCMTWLRVVEEDE